MSDTERFNFSTGNDDRTQEWIMTGGGSQKKFSGTYPQWEFWRILLLPISHFSNRQMEVVHFYLILNCHDLMTFFDMLANVEQ